MVNDNDSFGDKVIGGPKLRQFDVPDINYEEPPTSFNEDEAINNARIQKKLKLEGKERLTGSSKKRLELLLGMTQMYRDYVFKENTFSLKTLTSKELRQSYLMASEFAGTIEEPFAIRQNILARSLFKIENIPFEEFIGSNKIEDKISWMDEQDNGFLDRLFNEYLILKKESEDMFSIKTDSELNELVSDIKKA